MKHKLIGSVAGAVLVIAVVLGVLVFDKMPKPTPTPAPQPAPVPGPVDPTPKPEPPKPEPPKPEPAPPPQPFKVVVAGPKEAKAGDLVVLTVGGEADAYAWLSHPAEATYLVVDDGKRVIFSRGTGGEVTFYVAAVKDKAIIFVTHTVKIIGPTPTPPPGPGPGPTPPAPPTPSELEGKIAGWCDGVVSPTKRDDALKLSQSFLSISAMLSSGALVEVNPERVLELTKNSTIDALGSGIEAWVPFLESLRQELNAMGQAGKLNDAESHALAWRAIGNGLKRYAESL